jgi:TolB-like protein
MAPEQVQGRPADARSDLFALGCVLYEMLTGQRAFTRDSTAETLAAILRDPVPRVSLSQGGPFGPELEQVLSRCLEKAPAERFQNARDLAVALRTLAGAATGGAGPAGLMPETAGSKAIVVLPFENLSPDPDNAYFADGLTEEIIADLSKVRALRVISRTSAMHYKGAAKPLPVIAEELRVRYVLEGSVRKSGNSLRITANLIEANGELHLWGEKYSGTFDDVFAMQEQVSRAIVEALKVELTPQEARRLAEHPTQNPAAYECYLMARAEIWGLDGASLQRAMIILEQGLRRTPDDPLLLAGMAYTHWQRVNIGVAQEEELLIAEALATRALERSADLALGHLVLGLLMVWRPGRIKDAFRHFTRTLEINPNDLDAFAWLGLFSALLGRTESAGAYSARMIAINPLDWTSYLGLVWSQLMEGRFREVLATLGQLRRLAPDNEAVALFAIHPLLALGRDAEAGVLADAAERSDDPEVYHRLYPLLWYAHRGNREKVLSLLTPDLLETSRRDPEYSYRVATVYAVLGESDAALDWLGNAVHRGFLNHRYLSEVDPFLVSLRGDPRFRALMDEARELARAFGD